MIKRVFENIISKENLMDTFIKDVSKKKLPIALFGCGNALKLAIDFLKLYDLTPEILIDNDEDKKGRQMFGLIVNNFEDFRKKKKDYIVLIVPAEMSIINKIRLQLETVIQADNIYSFDFIHFIIYYNLQSIKSYKEFCLENLELLINLYNMLEDSKSKETLIGYISGKITNNYAYFNEICIGDMYFVKDLINFSDHEEVFVDCGAFDGDTIRDFITRVESYKKIYAFEPDKKNFAKLKSYISTNHLDNINCYNNAVLNIEKEINFKASVDSVSSRIIDSDSSGNYKINSVTLDKIIECPITHIKMDIEGSEFLALMGAQNLITNYKPKLSICVYHKYEDLIYIPKLLKELVPEYKFYLRHHAPYGSELILYSVAI